MFPQVVHTIAVGPQLLEIMVLLQLAPMVRIDMLLNLIFLDSMMEIQLLILSLIHYLMEQQQQLPIFL